MGEPKLEDAFVLDPKSIAHLIERAARAKAINDCSHVVTDVTLDEANHGYVGHIYYYWWGPSLKVVSRNNAQIERLTTYYIEAYTKRFFQASAQGPGQCLQELRSLNTTFETNWEAILRKHRKVKEFNYDQTKNIDFWINFTYGTKVTADLALILLSPHTKFNFLKGALPGIAYSIICKVCEASPWDAKVVAIGWKKVGSDGLEIAADAFVHQSEAYAYKCVEEYGKAQVEKAGQTLAGTMSKSQIVNQINAEKTLALKGVKTIGMVAGLLFIADDVKRAFWDGYVPKKKSPR